MIYGFRSFWDVSGSVCLKNTVNFGPKKGVILRLLGQNNEKFLMKMLFYDFFDHTMYIISHFTYSGSISDLLMRFGKFSTPIRS